MDEVLAARVAALEAELADSDTTMQRMSVLLTGVAAAIKGPPPPLTLHDWSDLPARAAELVTQRDALQAECTDWAMAADGVKHDWRCKNHFSSTGGDWLCLRCQVEALQTQLTACQRKVQRLADRVVPPGWHGPAEDF